MRNYNEETKGFLEVFGFLSEKARMNLVIFFITLLTTSNIFFIWRTINLNDKIHDLEKEKTQLVIDLNKQITEEVRKQIQPARERIYKAVEQIEQIQNTIDEDSLKNNK